MTRANSDPRPVLAITMGDPAGIGPEICVRAFSRADVRRTCRPVVVGDRTVLEATVEETGARLVVHPIASVASAGFGTNQIDVLDMENVDLKLLKKGKVSAEAGAAAYEYIVRAIDLAMQDAVSAIVTCPIHKKALREAGYQYPGHTEILAERTGTQEYAMMLVAKGLRVVLATIHMSLRDAIAHLTEKRILRTIRWAHEAGWLLGIETPRIAVPGLNPHAGEGGLFGREEIDIIAPAVEMARGMGYDVCGPLPADTVFWRAAQGEFDFVTSLYHDQGLIPIKLLGFGRGVNITLGLPIIRTSVDHGTAFDIAWQFRADAGSLTEAIALATQMAMTRPQRLSDEKKLTERS